MTKCLELARLARGATSPNPMVGCVIVNEQGEIVSTGYHHKYGENHAERDALLKLAGGEPMRKYFRAVREQAVHLLLSKGAMATFALLLALVLLSKVVKSSLSDFEAKLKNQERKAA